MKTAGLAVHCGVIKGSFFESIPAGADAYLFRHIIHDWTDEVFIDAGNLGKGYHFNLRLKFK